MKVSTLLFLVLMSFVSEAKIFDKLSSAEFVEETYVANKPSVLNIDLFLRDAKADISDSLPVILNLKFKDQEINDYIMISRNTQITLKSVFINSGDTCRIKLSINSSTPFEISDLKGNLSVKENILSFPSADKDNFNFTGALWHTSEVPLFRIEQTDSIKRGIKFFVTTNGNFEYDKLYLKLKVISPSHGIMHIDKEFEVNAGEYLSSTNQEFVLSLEGMDILKKGNYYFEFKQNHIVERVNGVVAIRYELTDY